MAINKKQAELIGIFKGLPYKNSYYTNKFAKKHLTVSDTINFDEVSDALSTLSIIPRGTKLPILDNRGFARISVRPDIIGGKSVITTNELLEIQAGQFELSNEAKNNFVELKERHLLNLKNALYRTMERASAEAYLKGEIKLAETGDVINFNYKTPTDLNFTEKTDNWELFILDLVDRYTKANGLEPSLVEVDMAIFKKMMASEKFRETAKAYNTHSITVNDRVVPAFNIFGITVSALPTAYGLDGQIIDTENLIYVSNNETFVQAYAGIGYATDKGLEIFKGEALVNEIIQKDPATHSFTVQSGYCPIIALPDRVQRYKVTVK